MTTTKKIQNGSLYFNVSANRVERAVGSINGRRLWTQHHKNQLKATPVRELRLAQSNEVESYKAESVVRLGLPPLPTKV